MPTNQNALPLYSEPFFRESHMINKMASGTCCICESPFNYQAKRKRYDRVSLDSKIRRQDATGRDALHRMGVYFTPEKVSNCYVCPQCNSLLETHLRLSNQRDTTKGRLKTAAKSSYLGQRIIMTPQTPRTPSSKVKKMRTEPSHKQPFLKNYKRSAAMYLSSSRYQSLFRILWKHSKAARQAMVCQLSSAVKKEVSNLCRPGITTVWRKGSKQGIASCAENFSWTNVVEETRSFCPTLTACLTGAISPYQQPVRRRGKAEISLLPNLGTIIGQIVFARKPNTMKFLQEIIGVQLWLSGTAREAFVRLNHLGLTLGNDAVRSTVDNFRKSFDQQLVVHQERLTNEIPTRRRLFDLDHLDSDDDSLLLDDSDLYNAETDLDDTISFGSDEAGETELHSIRVPSPEPDAMIDEAGETELHSIRVPSPEPDAMIDTDEEAGNQHAVAPVHYGVNAAVESADVLEQCAYSIVFDNVNQHIRARYTTRQKGNQMKNMVQAYAAIDRIPSLHLNDTQPSADDVGKIPVEAYLPDENDISNLRSDFVTVVTEQLVKQLPHFRTVVLDENVGHQYEHQSKKKSELIPLGVLDKDESRIADMVDIMDVYHKYVPGRREGEPVVIPLFGDGLSIERAYDAQNARINAAGPWEQLQGLHPSIQEWHKRVILLEDTFKKMYSQKSARSVGTLSYIRNTYRHNNIKADVHQCVNASTDLLRFATTSYILATALELMNCCKMSDVPENLPDNDKELGIYVHTIATQVVDLCFQPPNVSAVKSASTSDREPFQYCVCRNDTGEDMIMCDSAKCKSGKWFHFSCLDISDEDINSDTWFCETCRTRQFSSDKTDNKEDLVFQYTRSLLYRGIGEMVRHKAVRHNNGPRILSHWKVDLFEFYEYHHPKYFVCAHQILTDTHGGLSPRLAHQLTWNRTVNVKGGSGNNLEMDLQMEFFNKEFKEAVKDAGGNLSEITMARHSEMVGVAKQLGKLMCVMCDTGPQHSRKRGEIRREDDTQHLVDLLLKHRCCILSQPRSHLGFCDFQFPMHTSHPVNMRKRIEKHIKKRSKRLRLINARA